MPGSVSKHGAVTCIGYTDLPSRLPAQASTLYSNNISKFLLSMGPFTGHKEHFLVDHSDDAVRCARVKGGRSAAALCVWECARGERARARCPLRALQG